jgi:hypothetical protein
MNGSYFTEICRQMIYQLKKKRPELYEKGFILHIDNAPLTEQNTTSKYYPHPHYSPDEAPVTSMSSQI